MSTNVSLEFVSEVTTETDYFMEFTDQITRADGSNRPAEGAVDVIGNPEVNRMQLLIPGKSGASYGEPVTEEGSAINGAHEYGHTVGLNHQEYGTNKSVNGVPVGPHNLMRATSSEGRQQGGVNGQQLSILRNKVNTPQRVQQNQWNRKKAIDNKNQRAGKF